MFRIVYCLAFTFTSFYIVLVILIEADLVILSQVEGLQAEKRNVSASLAQAVEQHGLAEMIRQQELVTSMQNACHHYVGEMFESAATRINHILRSELQQRTANKNNASAGAMLQERSVERLQRYAADVNAFRSAYKERLSALLVPSSIVYRNYLELIFKSDWLSFPQLLFNESSKAEEQLGKSMSNEINFTGNEIDFAHFLELQEVDEVQLWSQQFWQR